MDETSTAIYIRLEGHLTEASLHEALGRAGRIPAAGAPMIVDCLAMTGYDGAARAEFVRWHRDNRSRIRAVAIVTDKPLWRLVISAMSLASGQEMRPFDDLASARSWVASL